MNLKKLLYSLSDAEHQNFIYKLKLDPKINTITIGPINDYYYFENGIIKKLQVDSTQEYAVEDNIITINNQEYELYVMTEIARADDLIAISDERLLHTIDLHTRKIDAPEFLSVQYEHYAETLYFVLDRYYDSMDLTMTNCIVQYEAQGQNYVYNVPFCDAMTLPDKIIVPWCISSSATQKPGKVTYLLRFYLIDAESITEDGCDFLYCLNTLPATSTVLPGMTLDGIAYLSNYHIDTDLNYHNVMEEVNQTLSNLGLYWIDV